MYKIIGGDGKEYGLISAEQMRQWISEGRLNAQTMVQAEDNTDWKPLSAFPEFSAPVAPPSSTFADDNRREAALQAVKGPAMALKVTAIIGLVLVAVGLVMNILSLAGIQVATQQSTDPEVQRILETFNKFGGVFSIVTNIIGGAIGVIILMGATKMRNLQSHQFAFTASILAMLPCVSPCCILGLPFGIWALVVLNKPEVKSAFH